METDIAFQIGKTHDVCEDFALSGTFGNGTIQYAVISDGCSTSPQTDTGARALSFSMVNELHQLFRNKSALFHFNEELCISMARASTNSLNVPNESLDATALMVYAEDDGNTNIDVKGDGAVAIGLKDGRILVFNIEFPNGYPFYLNYLPSYSYRYQQWVNLQEENGECKITTSIINVDGSYEVLDVGCNPVYSFCPSDDIDIGIGIRNTNHGCFISFNSPKKETANFITIMSDGISSFYQAANLKTSTKNTPLDYRDIIFEVLKFKSFKGKFMQRRLNRFLDRICLKNQWHHSDDISFGTIYFGDE